MRDEAPLYYDEEEDFYALTRHEDVAAAFKDHETYLVGTRLRPGDGAQRRVPQQKSIIFMDPPDHRHMRSLLNKAFTPRAIQSQRETIVEVIDQYLGQVDPDHFDVVQDFSGPFPVEVITRMAGVPEEYRQQVRHWIDTSLHREPGQIDIGEAGMQANIDTAMYYYGLVQERRANPQDDMISRLIAAEIPGEDGQLRKLDDIEITGFATLLGGAGAETVTKLIGSAVVDVRHAPRPVAEAARRPRARSPARSKSCCATTARCSTTSATPSRRRTCTGGTIPAGQAGVPDGRRRQPRSATPSPTPTHSTSSATGPRRRTSASGYGIHSCLGAALARHGERDRAGATARLHAALRGGLGRAAAGQHAKRGGLRPRAREGAAVSAMTKKIEVDLGLCESNGVCMGIIPEVFDLGDDDMLTVHQEEVTPENEADVREAVRQCPRQAIAIVGD